MVIIKFPGFFTFVLMWLTMNFYNLLIVAFITSCSCTPMDRHQSVPPLFMLECRDNFIFKILCFKSSFRFTAKLGGRYRDFPYIPCPYTCITSPIINILHQEVHLSQLINLHWHIIITQSPQFTSGFTFGVVHSMGLDQCKKGMYPSLWYHTEYFHCSKIFCLPPIHLSPPIQILATHIFHCLHSFAFPEYHIVRILQYVAFSDSLLSLCNMHLSFHHVFKGLDSSFLFSTE